MNKNDYKNEFDNIKCKPEFKEKLIKMLSEKNESEYADSVSHVEKAPKINYHRYTALAASAVIALGIGCGVWGLMANSPVDDPMSLSDVSSNDDLSDENTQQEINGTVSSLLDAAVDTYVDEADVTDDTESVFQYHSGSGQSEVSLLLRGFDYNNFTEILKGFDWEVSEKGFPEADFIVFADLLIAPDGEIYDTKTGTSYTICDENTSKLSDFLTRVGDISKISEIVDSGFRNCAICSDSVSYYFSTGDGIEAFGGEGSLYYDPEKNDAYMMLNKELFHDKKGYSGEFYMKNGNWVGMEFFDERQCQVSHGHDDMSYAVGSLLNIRAELNNALLEAMKDEENIKSFICCKSDKSDIINTALIYDNGKNEIKLTFNIDGNGVITYLNLKSYNYDKCLDRKYISYELGDYNNIDDEKTTAFEITEEMAGQYEALETNGYFDKG